MPCCRRTFPTEKLAFHSQSPSLVIVEQDAFLANPLLEYPVLRDQVMDHFLLLALDPANEDYEVELPRLQNEVHDYAVVVKWLEGRSP